MFTQGFGTPMGATVIEPIPGRIPFMSIDRYADRFGISGEAFDELLFFIGVLDREYLDIMAERSAQRYRAMQQQK